MTAIATTVLPVQSVAPASLGDGAFRYIDIASIDRENKTIVDPALINNQDAPSRARQVVKPNDVLVSTVRPNLNAVAFVPSELDGAIASTGFTVLRADLRKLDSRYLYHWVRTEQFVDEMTRLATGASYPAVSDAIVKRSEIPLPPLEEQRRIAEVLDRADALGQKRRLAIQKLDALIQSVFLDMFGDPIKNPKGWDPKHVGDVTTLVSSGSTPLGGNSTYVSEGIMFIRSQNVLMNSFDFSDVAFITDHVHNQMKRTWVKNRDVLFNITGASIGRVHYFEGKDDSANVNQHVCIIRADRGKIQPEFLSYFLSLPSFQSNVIGKNAGATRQAFNFEQIKRFNIFNPPLSEQDRFLNVVSKYKALSEKCRESVKFDERLFSSVQHRAFKGELFQDGK